VVMKYSGTASTSSWWMSLLNGQISFFFYYGSGSQISGTTSSTISANVWSHLAVTRDGNTVRLYIDGVQSGTINVTGLTMNDTATPVRIAVDSQDNYDFNGIISNVRIVNGTCLYPSGTTFTVPTAPLANVTNTKLLCCQSNSSVTTAAVSPNTLTSSGNAFAGTFSDSTAAEDSLRDSPTNGDTANDTGAGGEVPGNYATMSPVIGVVDYTQAAKSNGNLQVDWSASTTAWSDWGLTSGKWYYETTMLSGVSSGLGNWVRVGRRFSTSYNAFLWRSNGNTTGLTGSPTFSTYATGDVLGVAIDVDNEQATFYKNGVLQGTGAYSYTTAGGEPIHIGGYANVTSSTAFNFGQRPFAYSAPSGYKCLCTANLDTPTIEDGSTVMDVALYTGNNTSLSVTGLEFSPDFVWLKARSEARSNFLFDVIRGTGEWLKSDGTDPETTDVNTLTSFDTNGFSLGSSSKTNNNTIAYAGWCWDAGSSTVSNTDGSITSSVRANSTAGFSIVSYTGNNAASGTIGHGLGAKPELIIVKRTGTGGNDWGVYHSALGATENIDLNNSSGKSTTNGVWNDTEPTSSVFTVGTFDMVNAADTYIAYCFAPVEGYSAFGSYLGNGSSDGPMVYTGFRPAFVLIKRATGSSGNWMMYDNARGSYNLNSAKLAANLIDQENSALLGGSTLGLDLLSNGFKNRNDGGANHNASGSTYIYAAFAEHPFRSARAR